MEAVKKLEIISNSLGLQKVLDILEKVGVYGCIITKPYRGKVINRPLG